MTITRAEAQAVLSASKPPVPLLSPSPTASLTPGPVVVTETVAPGVERVIGLRETSSPASPLVLRFEEPGDVSMNHTGIGTDGGIWMLETDRLVRIDTGEHWPRAGVGSPDEPSWVPGIWDDLQIAADGTVFTRSWPIQSFDSTDETLTCVGGGGYAGLTAILALDWTANPVTIDGLIIPGELPPTP